MNKWRIVKRKYVFTVFSPEVKVGSSLQTPYNFKHLTVADSILEQHHYHNVKFNDESWYG